MPLLALFSLIFYVSVLSFTPPPVSRYTSTAPTAAEDCVLRNISSVPATFLSLTTLFNMRAWACVCVCVFASLLSHRFDPRAFRWVQTMRLAVEEINESTQLLLNHTLGYKIFDSCAYPLTGQRAALAVLNGLSEADSPMCSGTPAAIQDPYGNTNPNLYPQISYFSSCACFTDRRQYPTFFRVIPNDDYQVKAIAQLLQHFNWTWVGLIRGDHEYGRFAVQGLLRELQGSSVCVAYQEMIPLLYNTQRALEIMQVMRRSLAKVVVVFSAEGEMTPFLRDYMKQNITGIQWVASEAWVTASVFTGREFYPYLGGTIGFGVRKGHIAQLSDYLQTVNPQQYPNNVLVGELWEALYGCSPFPSSANPFPVCSGQEVLLKQHSAYMNTSSPRVAYNVYKAVYAVAHSLHNLLLCQPGNGPFENDSCAQSNKILPWQLQYYLQEVKFDMAGEEVNFDLKGDSVPYYDIINWQRGTTGSIEFVNVGLFDGTNLIVKKAGFANRTHIVPVKVPGSVCSPSCPPGSRKAVRRGEPVCCFDCVPCDSDSVECIFCPEDFWSNQDRTNCIPKKVEFLAYDALGIPLTVISVVGASLTIGVFVVFFYHRSTAVVRVDNSELSFFILLALTLCFLCSLVFIGEPTVWSCMLRHTWFGPKQQRAIIFSCTLVQVVICAAWLIDAPPYPIRNTKYERSKIILECNVGSSLAFWCVLGYIGLQACLCFVLAFLARKLPGNFNEAKYITFSMLIFSAVWLAFVPVYVSAPGNYAGAVESFAILASSFGLLFCLFAPKCYIILLKPEKNTNQTMRPIAEINTTCILITSEETFLGKKKKCKQIVETDVLFLF
uniref:Olfactory receptor C family, v1 n=1 Tax=Xiphophorus couchianus TaxID=32473 RepID=A0A3B5LPU7_9TELE